MSLMANKIEHVFLCSIVSYASMFTVHLDFFSVECMFKTFVHFSAGVFVFFLLVCRSFLKTHST